jgi:hypothetical protein
MTHNYFTLEQFAQTRQQELLHEAEQQRLVASVLDPRSKQIQRIAGRAVQLLLIVVVAVVLVRVLGSSMLHLMAAHHFSPQVVFHHLMAAHHFSPQVVQHL